MSRGYSAVAELFVYDKIGMHFSPQQFYQQHLPMLVFLPFHRPHPGTYSPVFRVMLYLRLTHVVITVGL